MSNLSNYLNGFCLATKKPYEFLSVQEESAENLKQLTKELYDFTKTGERQKYKNALPKLIIDHFDEEQIWQELELQNGSFTKDNVQIVSQLSAKKDKLNFPLKLKCIKTQSEENDKLSSVNNSLNSKEAEENEGSLKESDVVDEDLEEDDYGDSDFDDEDVGDGLSDDEDGTKNVKTKGKLKPSIVDDQFFKLSELELFLKNEEQPGNREGKDKDAFDFFEEIDGEADYKYSDFFENPENSENDGPLDKFNEDSGNIEEEYEEEEDYEEKESDEELEEDDEVIESHGDNKEEAKSSAIGDKTNKRKHKETDDNDDDSEGEDEEEHQMDKNKKKVRFTLLDSDEEESGFDNKERGQKDLFASSKMRNKQANEIKSSLEKRKERLDKVISRLEEDAIAEKPWQLKGEVSGNLRPENSLLEEAVDFDMSVRPAPMMTGEVTMKLEDIITQRIKDKAWDDVERKVKPVETPSEFKKKLALDQEKSKLSLAEVYEQEFIKQREAATADDTERQETEPALHVEVRSMLHSLFNKLDALSNYHYTPRPVAPELKVVSNVAAIAMEEVAPVATADSALLAPQEVRGKKFKGVQMSKEERTDTDKKRARRMKKTLQRQRKREKEKAAKEINKINPGLGNKYSKLKAEKQLMDVDVTANNVTKMDQKQDKVVKSSTAFFNKLQDEVKSQIKSKTSLFAKKKDKKNVTAKKLKL